MQNISRKRFLEYTALAGASSFIAAAERLVQSGTQRRLRVGIIGCGSVSNQYIPHLKKSSLIDIVSLCDIKHERAIRQKTTYGLKDAETYPNIDKMLAGNHFDMMITLTDMQEHGWINKRALEAGRHVWSEKPMANTYQEGADLYTFAQQKKLRLWGAPAVVNSPQFAFMNKAIQSGKIGTVSSAHGQYGHTGPTWSAFFYEAGGGSMPDLGVYNMATLTGLLGPALSVMAMTSIIKPKRTVDGKGEITVVAEDNAHILMEHENGVLAHVMCGFNYYDPHGHEGAEQTLHTIQIYGDKGNLRLIGYDWEPNGVYLDNEERQKTTPEVTDAEGYVWQEGATVTGEALIDQREPRINTEHALHVLEIIEAARKSSETGRKITLKSRFPWPMV